MAVCRVCTKPFHPQHLTAGGAFVILAFVRQSEGPEVQGHPWLHTEF